MPIASIRARCLISARPGPESDFYFVQADDPETAVGRIIELVKTRIPKRFGLDPIRDIQVLCPMNRGGNIELQEVLNPAGDRKVERFGWTFAPGDEVMQIENDYDKEIYNGDIGYIDDVDPNAGEIAVGFDGRSVTYGFGELDMLVPPTRRPSTRAKDRNIRQSSSRCSLNTTSCCNGTFSTPALPEASGWSFWLGRRRRSPSPFVMPPDGAGGQS
jgi:hypothetical protein